MTVTVFTYDDTLFRQQLPAFADVTKFPESLLSTFWTIGTNYISAENYGYLADDARQYGLNLMCAHQVTLNNLILAGKTPRITKSAGIDKVTATLDPPPTNSSSWRWWLNTTPYGQALLSLLSVKMSGGIFIGGSNESQGFRRAGGVFF